MKYFCVLGNNPALSLAEISAVLPLAKNTKIIDDKVFIFDNTDKIDYQKFIRSTGGIIKIGYIFKETKKGLFLNSVKPALKPKSGKYKFGISYYGRKKPNLKPLAMDIKNYLKEEGINSRWVTSRGPDLSSVVVEQNKLIDKGMEVVIVCDKEKYYWGKTLAVQPFKELSFRDYGRPARDDRSGMLPPKLAQIMINLAIPNREGGHVETRRGASLLDPFCGSGTVLTEAMLLGYKNLIGADISDKAVKDTEKNIEWIKLKCQMSNVKCQIFIKNVRQLSEAIKPFSIDTIVSEPYLGPQRGKININKTIKELEVLYSDALKEFKKVLKPRGRVVMIFPIFNQISTGRRGLQTAPSGQLFSNQPSLNFHGFKIINPIPKALRKHEAIKLTNRNTIIYGRQGQKVWREIVVLE